MIYYPRFLALNPGFSFTNLGFSTYCTLGVLCEKPRIVKSKPVIVDFKTRFRVETYDCRLFEHLASIMIKIPRFIRCIMGFSTNSLET